MQRRRVWRCMTSSRTTGHESTTAASATLAKAVAPEDIRRGDFITPLSVVYEVPSFFWYGGAWNLPHEEPVRMRYTTACDGVPLRVASVCLPFVLIKTPAGSHAMLDVRKCQLARLSDTHAKRAWKLFKKAATKTRPAPTI